MMEKLVEKIILWGREKGINNPDKQLNKYLEESGEIASALCHGHKQSTEMKDAIGDSLVTLIIFADILGYTVEECLEQAWGEIKNRQGKTVDGCFIKN